MARQCKSFRKVPSHIKDKLEGISANEVVVATSVKIPLQDIKSGVYGNVGVKFENDKLVYESRVFPGKEIGRYSKINREGYEDVKKDLPKVARTFYVEVPDFGDWSNGSHTVAMDRLVYQRDFLPPKELEIEVEKINEDFNGEIPFVVFRFSVAETLSKADEDFELNLLYDVNLLQESVGFSGVYPADAPLSAYLETLKIDWEILPPGSKDLNISTIIRGMRLVSDEVVKEIKSRYGVLEGLRPKAFISGSSGFRRYFGAKFEDDLVAFENVEYGNAMYIMFENWQELSRKTRIELMKCGGNDFVRIVHGKGWEANVEGVINARRQASRGSLL